MYYSMNIEEKIRIPSNMLAMDMEEAAKKVLRDTYERRIFKGVGFVISVDDVEITSPGVVVPGDPNIYYTAKFDALVFNASVNEVFESEVKEIVEFGAFCTIGPLDGLLHVSQIGGEKFYYDKKSKTLSSRGKKNVKKGDILLLKISTVSIKSSANDTKIGLTMRSEGLGKPEWLEDEKKKAKKPEKAEKSEKKEKK
jgi:DNA-directed RNA polymerase subunit E'